MAAARGPVLVAGATGYLGGFVVRSLRQHGLLVTTLVRPSASAGARDKLASLGVAVVEADACKPQSFRGTCTSIQTVVSCMAASPRQTHGTIWQVDRDANSALFDEAARAGVRHFILVATFEGREARGYSALSRAKEEAVDHITQRAQQLGMRCDIVRPTAYFKDLTDMPWAWVRDRGAATLIGSGATRYNPIDGADLAEFITGLVLQSNAVAGAAGAGEEQAAAGCDGGQAGEGLVRQHPIGGPQVFTLPQLLALAAEVQGKAPSSIRIRHVPLWLARLLAWGSRLLGRAWEPARRLADGLEFAVFSSTPGHDSVAPAFGSRTVREHYEELLRGSGN